MQQLRLSTVSRRDGACQLVGIVKKEVSPGRLK